jgi:hypothetical protein
VTSAPISTRAPLRDWVFCLLTHALVGMTALNLSTEPVGGRAAGDGSSLD